MQAFVSINCAIALIFRTCWWILLYHFDVSSVQKYGSCISFQHIPPASSIYPQQAICFSVKHSNNFQTENIPNDICLQQVARVEAIFTARIKTTNPMTCRNTHDRIFELSAPRKFQQASDRQVESGDFLVTRRSIYAFDGMTWLIDPLIDGN